jgi:hypothetical protein
LKSSDTDKLAIERLKKNKIHSINLAKIDTGNRTIGIVQICKTKIINKNDYFNNISQKIFQTDSLNTYMKRIEGNEKPQVGAHAHKTDQANQILKRNKREGQFPNGMKFINVRCKSIFFKIIYISNELIFLGTIRSTTIEF